MADMHSPLSMQTNQNVISWHLINYVVMAWLFGMIALLLIQISIGNNGLIISPSGEDFTWMRIIQTNIHHSLHHNWWAIASRNPLAPWWYYGISPLLLKHPETLYIARKFVDLFLAISIALLVYELLDRRTMWPAIWSAILVLSWNFSAYQEQVLFVMLIALCCTLFSVFFYLIYLKSNRIRHGYLIASLIFFFIALSTYSIQCGAPLAIMAFGLIYAMKKPGFSTKIIEIKKIILDLLGYLSIFVIFSMIWTTTSGPTSDFFVLDIDLIKHNFPLSIKYFLWHRSAANLFHSLITNWQKSMLILVASLSVILFTSLILFRQMRIDYATSKKREYFYSWLLPIVLIVVLALPTFALESTSNLWAPGTRSEMLHQIFNPLLYLFTFIFLIQASHLLIKNRGARLITSVFLVVICTAVTMLSLEYNRLLFVRTNFERNLTAGLKTILPKVTKPITFIAKINNYDWYDGHNPAISNLFVQYIYNNSTIALETVGDSSTVTSSDPIVFGSKEKGVYIPGSKRWVPYDTIRIVEVNEKGMIIKNDLLPNQLPSDIVKFSG